MDAIQFAYDCRQRGMSLKETKNSFFVHSAYVKLWNDPRFKKFVDWYYAECALIENQFKSE